MPEFVFILGKNAELSKAEIENYLKVRRMNFEETDSGEPFIVIKTSDLPPNMMEGLGGTLKIGEIIFSGEGVENANFDRLFSALPDKALFAISTYGSNVDGKALAELFKKQMKACGIKAGYLHSETSLTHTDIFKKKLLEKGAEFLACRGKKFWLAKTTAVHNPYEFQKRDMERPVQRAIFSIPPRLARIMVNLTNVTNGILLDPFCGIGSILQEAALAGFDVRGEDINETAVSGCKENLEWLEKKYGVTIGRINEKIRQGDARKLSTYFEADSVNAIVTEPYLGEPLKDKPNERQARQILEELGPLFEESVKEMGKVLKPHGRIVIVSPFFEADEKPVGLDMNQIASKAKLRLLQQIPDFEERHKTLRMINVLQKD
jgi:tRNA G10  N-methylase Trm11